MNARQGWNAAQRASEREPKKPRKMHGPVGLVLKGTSVELIESCKACGFSLHAPTCPSRPRLSIADRVAEKRRNETALFEHLLSERHNTEQLEADRPKVLRVFGLEEAVRLVNAGATVRCVRLANGRYADDLIRIAGGQTVVKGPAGPWSPSLFPRHEVYQGATYELGS